MNTQKEIKNAYNSKTDLILGKDLNGCFILREDAEANLIRKVRELQLKGYGLKEIMAKLTIQHPKAIFKDDAVRCELCGTEIYEDVNCDCGIDGSDHEKLKEAYEEKAAAAKTEQKEA